MKHKKRLNLKNNHLLRKRLKVAASHLHIKPVSVGMLAGITTGIAIGYLIKR
jgi:hypothetical protein